MAIKIIKNTMVDPIKITCEECESIIEYNYQDIQSGFTSGLFGFENMSDILFAQYARLESI